MSSDPHTNSTRKCGGSLARAGTLCLIVGILLILAPLVLGRGMLNKYIVTAGFLGACLGSALLLNGLLDHFLRRSK